VGNILEKLVTYKKDELPSGGAKMAAKEKGKIAEAMVEVGEEMEALEVALGEEVKEAPRADVEELKEHLKEKVGLIVDESDFPLERASEQARQAKAAIRVAEELKRNETTSAIVEGENSPLAGEVFLFLVSVDLLAKKKNAKKNKQKAKGLRHGLAARSQRARRPKAFSRGAVDQEKKSGLQPLATFFGGCGNISAFFLIAF
jgi:hypothetical protein